VAVFEIVVGLLIAAGLLTRAAAAAGLALNLIFFLTASWHTSPYFLGSDIVFVFAWLPFALAGAQGQPALDNSLKRPSPELARRTRLRAPAPGKALSEVDARITRRVLVAEIAGAGLAIARISALLKGPYTGPTATAQALTGGGRSAGGKGGTRRAPSPHARSASGHSGGRSP
jgi:thiosulfate dehydrogenase (quinone) large subunit